MPYVYKLIYSAFMRIVARFLAPHLIRVCIRYQTVSRLACSEFVEVQFVTRWQLPVGDVMRRSEDEIPEYAVGA